MGMLPEMYRFRLSAPQVQVELVANGTGPRVPFLVVGPATEVAYVEELLDEELGGLTLNPAELFAFLSNSPWIGEYFQSVSLIEGDLSASAAATADTSFASQPLGNKLVHAGILEMAELEDLLEAYRPFAETQRFGEFLRLNLQVPPQVLDLLLNRNLMDEGGFNEKRLGERLVDLGCISPAQLEAALEIQKASGQRIGEVLAAQGLISATMARFFSTARVNDQGQVDYSPE